MIQVYTFISFLKHVDLILIMHKLKRILLEAWDISLQYLKSVVEEVDWIAKTILVLPIILSPA